MSLQQKRFWLLLVYFAILTPFIGYGAWRAMETNANSPIDWVPESFPARSDYDRFRAAFGDGDVVVVSWPGCTIDEPKLDLFARVLREANAFYADDGDWYFERVITGREVLQKLEAAPTGLPREEALRRLRGTLIGPDGRTTCAVVTFTADGLKHRAKIVSHIRGTLIKYCKVSPNDWHLAGPVIDGLSVDMSGKRVLDNFAIPSAAIVFYVCWWCLRSFRAAALVFGLSVLAQGITLSLVHYSGETMSALLIVMPPLVQVLAVAGGIHLVNYYVNAAREPNESNPAQRAFQLGWLPCVLSAGTTAIGLASLTVSQLTPIRSFGAFASVGVLITTGLLLTFIPGTFLIWPLNINRNTADATAPRSRSAANEIWSLLTAWLAKTHGWVSVVSLAAMVFVGYGISRIETSVRIETLFSSNSRIIRDYAWLEKHVGPLVPIEIVLECDQNCTLSFRERLALTSRIERKIEQLDAVGATMSAATFAPQFSRRPEIPADVFQKLVDQELENNRQQFVDVQYLNDSVEGDRLRVTAYVNALDDMDYGEFLDVIRGEVAPLLKDKDGRPLAGLSAEYTGIMPLVHEIQRQLMKDLFKSFLTAFAIVLVVMTIVHGGLLAGLVSMVSNVFPTLLIFGGLGWLAFPLDIGSVMTASVALGIAVDDTLHFLTFFRRGIDAGLTRRDAVGYAYRHCGTAMVQTTITCGLGLLIFAFGDFVPTSRFAWMMSALLAAALWGDLVVLPSLLLGPLGKLFCSSVNDPETNDSETNEPTQLECGAVRICA